VKLSLRQRLAVSHHPTWTDGRTVSQSPAHPSDPDEPEAHYEVRRSKNASQHNGDKTLFTPRRMSIMFPSSCIEGTHRARHSGSGLVGTSRRGRQNQVVLHTSAMTSFRRRSTQSKQIGFVDRKLGSSCTMGRNIITSR